MKTPMEKLRAEMRRRDFAVDEWDEMRLLNEAWNAMSDAGWRNIKRLEAAYSAAVPSNFPLAL